MSDAAIAAAMQHEEDARASYAMQYEDAPPPPASSGLRREDVRPLAKADLRCTRAGVAAGALFDVAALFVLLLIASKRFPWGGGGSQLDFVLKGGDFIGEFASACTGSNQKPFVTIRLK